MRHTAVGVGHQHWRDHWLAGLDHKRRVDRHVFRGFVAVLEMDRVFAGVLIILDDFPQVPLMPDEHPVLVAIVPHLDLLAHIGLRII
jgi:hypothetical protein